MRKSSKKSVKKASKPAFRNINLRLPASDYDRLTRAAKGVHRSRTNFALCAVMGDIEFAESECI